MEKSVVEVVSEGFGTIVCKPHCLAIKSLFSFLSDLTPMPSNAAVLPWNQANSLCSDPVMDPGYSFGARQSFSRKSPVTSNAHQLLSVGRIGTQLFPSPDLSLGLDCSSQAAEVVG